MYKALFENSKGETFHFDYDSGVIFDMNIGDGVDVGITTSQGFRQIGETIQGQSVTGREIVVTGRIVKSIPYIKKAMRRIFAPFTEGVLTINNEYYSNVVVKSTPTFSPVADEGKFTMSFYSAYPYFFKSKTKAYEFSSTIARFSFPINYKIPHRFGDVTIESERNVINNGDVSVPFNAKITVLAGGDDLYIENINNFKHLKIEGRFSSTDVVYIGYDSNNVFTAYMVSDIEVTPNEYQRTKIDLLPRVAESSTLFDFDVGDNPLRVSLGGETLNTMVEVTFNESVVAVYED